MNAVHSPQYKILPKMEDDRAQVDLGSAADIEEAQASELAVKQPRKRFVGRRTAAEAASKNGTAPGSIEETGAVQGKSIAYAYSSLNEPILTLYL